ncbi:MAG: phage integrase SAM-like domain and Arm DNA-binding domain-containing protein [Bacteroidota bacterium]
MERSFGLLFYLKKRGASNDIEVPIFMRLTVDADITEVSIKRKCSADAWDTVRGRKKGRTDEVRYFNTYIDTIEQKVYEAKRKLIERNEEVQVDKVKELFLGRDIFQKKYMLLETFAAHNHQLKELVGKQYAVNTLIRFATAYKLVEKFLMWKYKTSDVNIKELNYEFVSDLEFWFKSVRSCNHNTAMKYIGNLRKVVNKCIKNGWLPRYPFFGYKMSREEVERTALPQASLDVIAEKNFTA